MDRSFPLTCVLYKSNICFLLFKRNRIVQKPQHTKMPVNQADPGSAEYTPAQFHTENETCPLTPLSPPLSQYMTLLEILILAPLPPPASPHSHFTQRRPFRPSIFNIF